MILYAGLLILVLMGLLLVLDKNINDKQSLNYFRIIIFLLMIISSLRGSSVGNDTSKYIVLFKNIQNLPIDYFTDRYEIGFIYLNKFCGYISSNPQIIIVVSSVIIWLGIYFFIKNNSNNYCFSLFFLITFGFFAFFLSGIRESIAIVICLQSFEYIKEKNLIKSSVIILFASLFHSSALCFLLVYPLFYIKNTHKFNLILLCIGFILYPFYGRIMNLVVTYIPKYSSYVTSIYNDGDIRLASIMNLLVVLSVSIFCIYMKNKIYKSSDIDGYINILLVGALILFLSLQFSLLDRVANYFIIFMIVAIPRLLDLKRYKQFLITIFLIVCFTSYFFVVQTTKPEWNTIYPYSIFTVK